MWLFHNLENGWRNAIRFVWQLEKRNNFSRMGAPFNRWIMRCTKSFKPHDFHAHLKIASGFSWCYSYLMPHLTTMTTKTLTKTTKTMKKNQPSDTWRENDKQRYRKWIAWSYAVQICSILHAVNSFFQSQWRLINFWCCANWPEECRAFSWHQFQNNKQFHVALHRHVAMRFTNRI